MVAMLSTCQQTYYQHQDKIDIDTWGLDVFSAARTIRDSRVLTATTFKIFQERGLCHTFKIDQKTLLTFLMTIEDHYLKVSIYNMFLFLSLFKTIFLIRVFRITITCTRQM